MFPEICHVETETVQPECMDLARQWAPDAVKYATAAGVDPRLLLAILLKEGSGTADWGGLAMLFQWWQLGAERRGTYHPLKVTLCFALGCKASPPSLGYGSIQEDLFNRTRAKRPELAGRSWSDMITDHQLAMKATAFILGDLQEQVAAQIPIANRGGFSLAELTASAYNIGMDKLMAALATGKVKGPSDYTKDVMGNYQEADRVICQSGVWTC